MIKLSSKTYHITGIETAQFWDKLDEITCGQHINPEISYTTKHLGNFDNIFAGRKSGNKFSIYLYRPIEQGFRTEILAKGKIRELKDGIKIDINYEIPMWSILVFIFIGSLTLLPLWLNHSIIGIVITLIVSIIYLLVINSNHNDIKKEMKKQFIKFKKEYKH